MNDFQELQHEGYANGSHSIAVLLSCLQSVRWTSGLGQEHNSSLEKYHNNMAAVQLSSAFVLIVTVYEPLELVRHNLVRDR
jgi:hypothetical protein